LTCPSGNLTTIDEEVHVLLTRGCSVKDAVARSAAFLRVVSKWGSAIDAALATIVKTIVTDDKFSWKEGGHTDKVRARQQVPRCWQPLSPRLDTRADIDREIQKLSEQLMDTYGAAAAATLTDVVGGGSMGGSFIGYGGAGGRGSQMGGPGAGNGVEEDDYFCMGPGV